MLLLNLLCRASRRHIRYVEPLLRKSALSRTGLTQVAASRLETFGARELKTEISDDTVGGNSFIRTSRQAPVVYTPLTLSTTAIPLR
jgi:hypothetical protein